MDQNIPAAAPDPPEFRAAAVLGFLQGAIADRGRRQGFVPGATPGETRAA